MIIISVVIIRPSVFIFFFFFHAEFSIHSSAGDLERTLCFDLKFYNHRQLFDLVDRKSHIIVERQYDASICFVELLILFHFNCFCFLFLVKS